MKWLRRLFRRQPVVTVVVATYRRFGLFVPLQCLARQTRPPDHVVIVTDGVLLNDALGPSALPWRLKIRHKHVYNHNDYGSAIPLNSGLDAVPRDTTHMMVLADHTYVREGWVEQHLAYHEEAERAIVSGATKLHEESDPFHFPGEHCACRGTWMPFRPSGEPIFVGTLATGQQAADCVYNSSLSIRMDVMKKIGGWDERFEGGYGYDDFTLAHRAEAQSGKPAVVSFAASMIAHRLQHGKGVRRPVRDMEENFKLYERIKKYELLSKAFRTR